MRHLTFGYLTLAECPQTEIVEAAASAGFTSVGLRVEERRAGDGYPHRVVGNATRIREIKRALDACGMSLSNVCGRYLEAATRDDDLRAIADTAAELGCRYILTNGYDDDEQRTIDNLARLATFAAPAGVKVAVEFVPYQRIRNLEEAYRMVTATGSANAGLVPDPLHLSRSGGHPRDLAKVPPERLFYAQICDAPAMRPPTLEGCLAEARTGRLYPGEGGLPLADYVRALPADCEIEVEVANAAHEAMAPRARAAEVGSALRRFMATM
jgi:sugar phosphate isomerase/epimerase